MDFQLFLNTYQNVPVEIYPFQESPHQPLVSVCVVTYQHAKYIKQCLDGILMQETTFPFEILLGEDESKDGTREVCINYANKHPDKIRLFLHSRLNNIKIQGQPSGRFNFMYNLYQAKGKYIALCEGDDFWHSPNKLEDQLEFMRQNQTVMLTFHGSAIFSADQNTFLPPQKLGVEWDRKIVPKEWIIEKGGTFVPTPSMMMMKEIVTDTPEWIIKAPVADFPIVLHALTKGDIGYLDDILCTYRKNAIGSWSNSEFQFDQYFDFFQNTTGYLNYFSSLTKGVFNDSLDKLNHKRKYMLISRYFRNEKSLKKRLLFLSKHFSSLSPKSNGKLFIKAFLK